MFGRGSHLQASLPEPHQQSSSRGKDGSCLSCTIVCLLCAPSHSCPSQESPLPLRWDKKQKEQKPHSASLLHIHTSPPPCRGQNFRNCHIKYRVRDLNWATNNLQSTTGNPESPSVRIPNISLRNPAFSLFTSAGQDCKASGRLSPTIS